MSHAMISLLLIGLSLFLYHTFLNKDKLIIEDQAALFRKVNEKDFYINRYNSILSSTHPSNFVKTADKSKASVVFVISYEKMEGSVYSEGYKRERGSGVIISDDGYIVTNEHVIAEADFVEITLEDKREFVAEVVGIDKTSDLALLKIETSNLPYLIFGNSDSLQVGEWILTIGNPFGMQSTVSAGIVSAKARNIDVLDQNALESFIQTDAVINPGSSGGALVNTNGLLMGISTAIVSSSGGYEGLSFAIPSNLAHKVIIDLREFGSVQRGKLGITIANVDANTARQVGLEQITGVLVASVNLNSAAAEAGISRGDIITHIQETAISSPSEFYERINRYRPGDKLNLSYFRKSKSSQTAVTLRNHLNTTDFLRVRSDKILRNIGIEIRDLNSIEKSRMNAEGVMVISVSKGSDIHNTNMEAGFIVTHFNSNRIYDVDEFISLLKKTEGHITLNGFYERYPGEFVYEFDYVSNSQR